MTSSAAVSPFRNNTTAIITATSSTFSDHVHRPFAKLLFSPLVAIVLVIAHT